jgi:hypothetical protein
MALIYAERQTEMIKLAVTFHNHSTHLEGFNSKQQHSNHAESVFYFNFYDCW